MKTIPLLFVFFVNQATAQIPTVKFSSVGADYKSCENKDLALSSFISSTEKAMVEYRCKFIEEHKMSLPCPAMTCKDVKFIEASDGNVLLVPYQVNIGPKVKIDSGVKICGAVNISGDAVITGKTVIKGAVNITDASISDSNIFGTFPGVDITGSKVKISDSNIFDIVTIDGRNTQVNISKSLVFYNAKIMGNNRPDPISISGASIGYDLNACKEKKSKGSIPTIYGDKTHYCSPFAFVSHPVIQGSNISIEGKGANPVSVFGGVYNSTMDKKVVISSDEKNQTIIGINAYVDAPANITKGKLYDTDIIDPVMNKSFENARTANRFAGTRIDEENYKKVASSSIVKSLPKGAAEAWLSKASFSKSYVSSNGNEVVSAKDAQINEKGDYDKFYEIDNSGNIIKTLDALPKNVAVKNYDNVEVVCLVKVPSGGCGGYRLIRHNVKGYDEVDDLIPLRK